MAISFTSIALHWPISTTGLPFCRRRSAMPPFSGRCVRGGIDRRVSVLQVNAPHSPQPRGRRSLTHTLARLSVPTELCQFHQLLGIRRIITLICDETCLCVGFVSSGTKLFVLLDSLQRLSHFEKILHTSVPMGGHLHAKLVVTHPQEELVHDHLLLGVLVHEWPC